MATLSEGDENKEEGFDVSRSLRKKKIKKESADRISEPHA